MVSIQPVRNHGKYYCEVSIRCHKRPANDHWRVRMSLKSVRTTLSYVRYVVMTYYIGFLDTMSLLSLLIVITNSGRQFCRTVEA